MLQNWINFTTKIIWTNWSLIKQGKRKTKVSYYRPDVTEIESNIQILSPYSANPLSSANSKL